MPRCIQRRATGTHFLSLLFKPSLDDPKQQQSQQKQQQEAQSRQKRDYHLRNRSEGGGLNGRGQASSACEKQQDHDPPFPSTQSNPPLFPRRMSTWETPSETRSLPPADF